MSRTRRPRPPRVVPRRTAALAAGLALSATRGAWTAAPAEAHQPARAHLVVDRDGGGDGT
ncbi:hypothetical protein [Streptomyces sp. PT12]|uniref:hypothetical protein n=1 Tax=Streptomyces sp. PT12 TaxID=1510197 RepID=UPI0011BDE169|nr:hypothetical protein [Streptomyces sp. PT12]